MPACRYPQRRNPRTGRCKKPCSKKQKISPSTGRCVLRKKRTRPLYYDNFIPGYNDDMEYDSDDFVNPEIDLSGGFPVDTKIPNTEINTVNPTENPIIEVIPEFENLEMNPVQPSAPEKSEVFSLEQTALDIFRGIYDAASAKEKNVRGIFKIESDYDCDPDEDIEHGEQNTECGITHVEMDVPEIRVDFFQPVAEDQGYIGWFTMVGKEFDPSVFETVFDALKNWRVFDAVYLFDTHFWRVQSSMDYDSDLGKDNFIENIKEIFKGDIEDTKKMLFDNGLSCTEHQYNEPVEKVVRAKMSRSFWLGLSYAATSKIINDAFNGVSSDPISLAKGLYDTTGSHVSGNSKNQTMSELRDVLVDLSDRVDENILKKFLVSVMKGNRTKAIEHINSAVGGKHTEVGLAMIDLGNGLTAENSTQVLTNLTEKITGGDSPTPIGRQPRPGDRKMVEVINNLSGNDQLTERGLNNIVDNTAIAMDLTSVGNYESLVTTMNSLNPDAILEVAPVINVAMEETSIDLDEFDLEGEESTPQVNAAKAGADRQAAEAEYIRAALPSERQPRILQPQPQQNVLPGGGQSPVPVNLISH